MLASDAKTKLDGSNLELELELANLALKFLSLGSALSVEVEKVVKQETSSVSQVYLSHRFLLTLSTPNLNHLL